MNENGNVFYPQLLKQGVFWYYWIKTKAGAATAARFDVKAEAQNLENNLKMTFTGPVHPIDMSVEEIMKSGHYLLMNRQNVEQLKIECNQEENNRCYSHQLDLKFTIIIANN